MGPLYSCGWLTTIASRWVWLQAQLAASPVVDRTESWCGWLHGPGFPCLVLACWYGQGCVLKWLAVWLRVSQCCFWLTGGWGWVLGLVLVCWWASKPSMLKDRVKWSESCSVVSDFLQPHGLYSPWNSPGQNTGVGSLSLLQGIFPTQGSNPGLCIAGGFFTSWVVREAWEYWSG